MCQLNLFNKVLYELLTIAQFEFELLIPCSVRCPARSMSNLIEICNEIINTDMAKIAAIKVVANILFAKLRLVLSSPCNITGTIRWRALKRSRHLMSSQTEP